MPRAPWSPTSPSLVAVVVATALLLEGIFVPLHLTVFDHVHPGEASRHEHVAVSDGVDGHGHGPVQVGPAGSNPEHRPHPAEDHQDRSTESIPSPARGPLLAALPIAPGRWIPDVPLLCSQAVHPVREPRPPPSPSVRVPRAPPIAV